MDEYNISAEDSGKQIIYEHKLFPRIFGSEIETEWPFNSCQQKHNGWDFTLKNKLNIDLKNEVGERKDKPGCFRDKLVLSYKRSFDNGKTWHDCLTNKKTDIWFYPVQINESMIEFYWIDKSAIPGLIKDYPTYKDYNPKGGNLQEYMVIDLNDGRYVKKADFYLNRVTGKLEDNKDKFQPYNLY